MSENSNANMASHPGLGGSSRGKRPGPRGAGPPSSAKRSRMAHHQVGGPRSHPGSTTSPRAARIPTIPGGAAPPRAVQSLTGTTSAPTTPTRIPIFIDIHVRDDVTPRDQAAIQEAIHRYILQCQGYFIDGPLRVGTTGQPFPAAIVHGHIELPYHIALAHGGRIHTRHAGHPHPLRVMPLVNLYRLHHAIEQFGITQTGGTQSGGGAIAPLYAMTPDELPIYTRYSLPHHQFDHCWHQLIFDGNLKTQLVSYLRLLCRWHSSMGGGRRNDGRDSDTHHSASTLTMTHHPQGTHQNITLHHFILLRGPPGTGKTSLALGLAQIYAIRREYYEAAALGSTTTSYASPREQEKEGRRGGGETGERSAQPAVKLYHFHLHALLSKWFSQSARHLTQAFRTILLQAEELPSTLHVVLLDEMEIIAMARQHGAPSSSSSSSSAQPHGESVNIVTAFLQALDAIYHQHQRHGVGNILVIGTTNTDDLDPAIVDRADVTYHIGNPSVVTRYTVLLQAIHSLAQQRAIRLELCGGGQHCSIHGEPAATGASHQLLPLVDLFRLFPAIQDCLQRFQRVWGDASGVVHPDELGTTGQGAAERVLCELITVLDRHLCGIAQHLAERQGSAGRGDGGGIHRFICSTTGGTAGHTHRNRTHNCVSQTLSPCQCTATIHGTPAASTPCTCMLWSLWILRIALVTHHQSIRTTMKLLIRAMAYIEALQLDPPMPCVDGETSSSDSHGAMHDHTTVEMTPPADGCSSSPILIHMDDIPHCSCARLTQDQPLPPCMDALLVAFQHTIAGSVRFTHG